MPAVPPYSSMTSASRTRRRRISASRSSAVSVSGTVKRFARERGDIDLGVRRHQRRDEIRHVQHADDVVEVALVDRQTGMASGGDLIDDRLTRRADGNRDQLRAGHHDLAGVEIREAEDAVEHLLLQLFEHARFLAGRHQHLQLFFGVHHRAPIGAAEPERLDDRLRRAVHQANERPEHAHEELERL